MLKIAVVIGFPPRQKAQLFQVHLVFIQVLWYQVVFNTFEDLTHGRFSKLIGWLLPFKSVAVRELPRVTFAVNSVQIFFFKQYKNLDVWTTFVSIRTPTKLFCVFVNRDFLTVPALKQLKEILKFYCRKLMRGASILPESETFQIPDMRALLFPASVIDIFCRLFQKKFAASWLFNKVSATDLV